MFTTNNIEYYTMLLKSKFNPGSSYIGKKVENIRSSLNQNSPGKSEVFLRSNIGDDPHVSLTNLNRDLLYCGDSLVADASYS